MKQFLLVACLGVILTAQSFGNLLVNPSFEDDVLADGTMTSQYGYPQGWTDGDPMAVKNPKRDVRVWNPTGDGAGADDFPTTGIPDGDNVSYHRVGQHGPALAQIVQLSSPIQAGDQFEVSFWYGAPVTDPSGLTGSINALYTLYGMADPAGNYWAVGNTEILETRFTWGSGVNFLSPVAGYEGRFKLYDGVVEIPAGSAAIGMDYLMLYLIGYNGVCFDNVSLVPEPATLALLFAGTGLLVRRRKV